MVIIFAICSLYLLYQAFVLMSQGWDAASQIIETRATKVHPELEGVKQGDELMVVNFTKDPLHASLQNRINNGMEISDPWIDEDDEDDEGEGDVPAVVRR